ncbi:ferrochelatase [Thiomicrospira sp. WB1]|uniref:ferrochelatase n=1 Tax=Thiomicrospira sp. WB1 TaxID=1685380 RepID=UPI00074A2578|nr:ferrochelatase [Thiomicrospira sp. WB1]KUJ71474.1 ferrochelatase [Thiomicrospira sp. WB1]
MHYKNFTAYQHGTEPAVGVLLTNLGTPDAPTKAALKPYLKEFLEDPRVVEPPPARWLWKLILNAIILNTRPAKSAEAYQEVWGHYGDGSPLLDIGNKQLEAVKTSVSQHFQGRVEFALGMRYGNPSIPDALKSLQERHVQKLVVLPMYPQYAGATTASTFDAVTDELRQWRWVPEFRFIKSYHKHPGYIKALANSIREHQAEHGQPDLLVMSYHGIPQRYYNNGDPYACECRATSRLVAEELGLSEDDYLVSFQSLFGKEEWIKPYTDATLKGLPEKGIKHVQVICPGFSADCLETIEEIDQENREYFEEAGGEQYSYIPALNFREDHTDMLAELVLQHTQGWPERDGFDAEAAKAERATQARRAQEVEQSLLDEFGEEIIYPQGKKHLG